jgi:hypothetical protein
MVPTDTKVKAADSAAQERFIMILPRKRPLAGPLLSGIQHAVPVAPGDKHRAGDKIPL